MSLDLDSVKKSRVNLLKFFIKCARHWRSLGIRDQQKDAEKSILQTIDDLGGLAAIW